MMRLLAVSIALVTPLGCAPAPQRLMPTPSVVALGLVDPAAGVAADRQRTTGSVFIASDRELRTSGDTGADPFTNSRGDALHLAVSEVTIGRGLDYDEMIEAAGGSRHLDRPVVQVEHTEVVGVLPATVSLEIADAERWIGQLNAALGSRTPGSDVLVYVHGYNTDFRVNTGRASEFWHYRGRGGAVVSFDWPSRYRVVGYGADKANAAYAVRHMRQLLELLADHTDAGQIHILAHSAGCPIVVDALRELRLRGSGLGEEEIRARYRIGRVALAAPDMDLMLFCNALLDGFDDLPERIAVYASQGDDVLQISGLLFGSDRLGLPVHDMSAWETELVRQSGNTEIIDVTSADDVLGELMGHSYYRRNPWVSSDLLLLLGPGRSAAARGLVLDAETGFWRFPDDYLDRLGGLLGPGASAAE
ncbi:MAG: alpha/beta hydrolase [Phycisphaerales bacterium JB054]